MANMIMASTRTLTPPTPSLSTTPKPKLSMSQITLPKLPTPKITKHQLLKLSTSTLKSLSLVAATSLTLAPPSLSVEMEKAALFDFNLTLPIIVAEFLFLMVALDKIYYTPVGKFMDERDAAIRAKLNDVKDTSGEVKQLEEQAAAVMKAARAEIAAALSKMKKETQEEVEQKLAEGRKKVEAELQEALASLELQKEETLKALDSQIAALSQEIVKKSKHKEDASATRPILFDEPEFEAKPEPISIYHPVAEEISSSMGTPMEGFFDGADVVFEAAAPATPAAASRVSTKAPIPSTEPVPIDEGTHTKRDSETAPIPAETLTPQERAIPPVVAQTEVAQTEVASLATPFIISTSDPFAALSQAVKDGSSLVVTPSSISSFTTRGPDADLSSEGSEDVLEDPDDEPTMKKRVSDSNEEESADHKAEFMETFEEPRVAADTEMPTATSPATPVTPVSVMFSTPVSAVSTVSVYAVPTVSVSATLPAPIPAISTNPILTGPSPLPTARSQFEVGSSSATVPDPMSEAAAFFARFDQPEVNDLDPVDFWGSGPPYVDFHDFRVPEDCASHLKAVYSSHGDFMQGFRLGRSAREHFLKLLGSVMNDIEHNFVDTVSTERILQWRAAVQELVSVGFAVEFILDHLREIVRAFFMRKVQPAVDAIDTRIEALRKEVADLEGRRERLLSSIDGSNHFGDQPLISRLR